MHQRSTRLPLIGIVFLAFGSLILAFPELAYFPRVVSSLEALNIKLGLDLQGGARLEYEAKTENIPPDRIKDALDAAQGVVERRVNATGVSEAKVQQALSGQSHRIIVEIPGIRDISQAKNTIKDAPMLEFREEKSENPEAQKLLDQLNENSQKQAEEILKKAISGEDFTELAKNSNSDSLLKESGGDIGFIERGKPIEKWYGITIPEFDSALFEDGFSLDSIYPRLLETNFGWFVVKKEEERFVRSDNGETVDGPGEGREKQIHVRQIFFQKMSLDVLKANVPSLFYFPTGLTGQHLRSATVESSSRQYGVSEPQVSLLFNDEGTKLFEEITKRNIEKPLAIFVDDQLVMDPPPVVRDIISDGRAQITGNYTLEEAKELAKRLNEGALPIPLELVGEDITSPTLGKEELTLSIRAGVAGIIAIVMFVIMYYRLPGVVAGIALILYSLLLIAIFKLSGIGGSQLQITLSLAGIAGFILSIGMAIDANILIFERMKEELRLGKPLRQSVIEGFRRAWSSIWDSNISTLLTSVILIGIGTGFVKGFALVLGLGVVLSMFSAISITRIILLSLPLEKLERYPFLFLGKAKR